MQCHFCMGILILCSWAAATLKSQGVWGFLSKVWSIAWWAVFEPNSLKSISYSW